MPIRRILRLLTPVERRAAARLFGLMVVGMVLEAFGVGLVVPAIALLTQDDYFSRYPSLEPVLRTFEAHGRHTTIVAGLAALIAVYAIKAVFLAFLAWRETHFAFDVQAQLSQRLFTAYLRQPWIFHLQRNSALLMRNVVNEVSLFTLEGALPAMVLLTEAMVLTGLCTLLLVLEPLGAFAALATLGTAAWGMLRFTGALSSHWGSAYEYHDGLRMQHLQQGLGGAKDVKLLGREADFLDQYRRHNLQSAHAAQMQTFVQQLPRLWLEVFAITALAVVAAVMLWQERPVDTIVPALAMFAAAAMRLIPSANRLVHSIQSLRYCAPAIETIERELRLEAREAPPRSPARLFASALELRSVSYVYPGAASNALEDISLVVRRGECVGIVGPSGAGKSTLIDVALGLLTASSGEVLVDGRDIGIDVRGWQDQIGYVPQSIFLTDDTLRRNIAFGLADEQIDDLAVRGAIRAAQLQEFVEALPAKLDAIVGERGVRLSGGQRQRIGIARALYHDPALLVLDEATSSLDLQTERGVIDAVSALQGSKTIIIVSHRASTVEHCQRIYRLQNSRVVESDRSTMCSGEE